MSILNLKNSVLCRLTIKKTLLLLLCYGLIAETTSLFQTFQKWSHLNKFGSSLTNTTSAENTFIRTRRQYPSRGCVMPKSLPNGTYSIRGALVVKEDQLAPDGALLELTCPPGYTSSSSGINFCDNTNWYEEVATCQKMCKPPKSLTVEFTCSLPLKNGQSNRSNCEGLLHSGTHASPRCQRGHHSLTSNKDILCDNGKWWYTMPSCKAECGKTIPIGKPNVINGTDVVKGEFPWHVAVYTRIGINENTSPPRYWCGGSIISRVFVISAAHCFYNPATSQLYAKELFTTAVGKLYSQFESAKECFDPYIQKSEVKLIRIPPNYEGESNGYSHDLALVLLETPLNFSNFIMPVCLNLNEKNFDEEQSSPGLNARVAGFGLVDVNGDPSDVLKTATMPIISKSQCKQQSPKEFSKYIIWDKLCAGHLDGIGVCKGDSGGGLVVSTLERGSVTWYLRGIVSTSPASETNDECSTNTYSTFTRPFLFNEFIEDVIYRGRCVMPEDPLNGKFTLVGLSNAVPGQTVVHRSQLTLRCVRDFVPSDRENNICDEFTDDWMRKISTCEVSVTESAAVTPSTDIPHISSNQTNGCVMPSDNPTTKYSLLSAAVVNPGEVVNDQSVLKFDCLGGTTSTLPNILLCSRNKWASDIPICENMCDPPESMTVVFTCSVLKNGIRNRVPCDERLPSGTEAFPVCQGGHSKNEPLKKLTCTNGSWDRYMPRCTPNCGTVIPKGVANIIQGEDARKGEFPWHVVIYTQFKQEGLGLDPKYWCGGSILNRNTIISIAKCFYDPKQKKIVDPGLFTIAAGKMYSSFNHIEQNKDKYIQKSVVKDIKISEFYSGLADGDANDVALLILETPLNFSNSVLPVCLDLNDEIFDADQLTPGVVGRIAGFGRVQSDAKTFSDVLKTTSMPIISRNQCKEDSPPEIEMFLISDKFCAGYLNGTGVCTGDAGSALVVKTNIKNVETWFLRGILSIAFARDQTTKCKTHTYAVFTKPFHHRSFIENILH